MGLDDIWLQSNNGKKVSLQNLKELKKSDLKGSSALLKIFNIFDTQSSDGTKGPDGILNKEELTSLFNTMSNIAKSKGNSSVFEADEAEDYINSTQTQDGQTLKQLGITATELFNFINALVTKNESYTTSQNEVQQPYKSEDVKNFSLQAIYENVALGKQLFYSQNENQGVVSDFVNGTKETFDTEYAASRVNRYLMREELCLHLLKQSQSEKGLSEKEYLEAKINLAVSMLPKLQNSALKSSIVKNMISMGLYSALENMTKANEERIAEEMEIELLKDALRKLKPEDLTLFIQQITDMSDEEYAEKTGQLVENMINESLQDKMQDNQHPMPESTSTLKTKPAPESIEYIEQQSNNYKKMTFEETFEAERGVSYNQESIMDYVEKDAKMQFLLGMHNKRQEIYNILHDATVTVDGNNKLGTHDSRATQPCEKQLESAIIQALSKLYGDDMSKMQAGLDKLGFKNLKIIQNSDANDLLHPMKLVYDNEQDNNPTPLLNQVNLNGYNLVNIANKLQNYIDTNYEMALGGKTLDEHSEELSNAYNLAFGARNSQHIAETFIESQQEGVQTIKSTIQTGAMAIMIAGQLIPIGGAMTTMLTMGGLTTSTVGGTGVSALENFTKVGGPTKEDKQEMINELSTSLALVSSGIGIGKSAEAAFRALVIKNCPKLLAFASEVGIDATMSLVADYAITGQIDLSGEGIAQLQGILVGILHAKGNFNSYLNTHAGNISTKQEANVPASHKEKMQIDNTKLVTETTKTNSPESTNNTGLFIKTREELVNILSNKINDPQLLTELKNLSDKDFAIIQKITNEECLLPDDPKGSLIYITNTMKLIQDHAKSKNITLSEELVFINKILSAPPMPNESYIIDCRAALRLQFNLKQLDIVESLLKLRETCYNPILNIDNIIMLSYEFENISDINLLINRFTAKDQNGMYKYNINDYEKYDIDPSLKSRELEIKKQTLIDNYKDYPEVQQKIIELIQNEDADFVFHVNLKLQEYSIQDSKLSKDKVSKILLAKLKECNMDYIKQEINYLLENVEDNTFKKMIIDAISEVNNLTYTQNLNRLSELQNIVEMYHNLKGKSLSTNSVFWKDYLKELAKTEPELAAKLQGKEPDPPKTEETTAENNKTDMSKSNTLTAKTLQKLKQLILKIQQEFLQVLSALGLKLPDLDIDIKSDNVKQYQEYYDYLISELSASQMTEKFIEYCKYNKNESCNYLYNEIYLNSRDFEPEIKDKCLKISNEYGVKVFLEANIDDSDCLKLLNELDEEFKKWNKASKYRAIMPPTLDLTITKSNYIDPESAYGQSTSAGFSESYTKAISINGQENFDIENLRHEMTHSNDLKSLENFPSNDFVIKDAAGKIIEKQCKYYNEFVKIGIPQYHISYAYNNPMEFIAVASEGNLKLCSAEFKQVLLDFGMPEWRFDFDD